MVAGMRRTASVTHTPISRSPASSAAAAIVTNGSMTACGLDTTADALQLRHSSSEAKPSR
jgi:hypothetical protein